VVRGRHRCHWHGGRNPGPALGSQHALVHGRYSAAAIEAKREASAAGRAARAAVADAVSAAEAMLVAGKPPPKRQRKKVTADGT
jgi:hypothetical protein